MEFLIGLVIVAIGAGLGTVIERKKWQKATGKTRARDV